MPIDVFLVSAYGAGATRLPAQILARSQRSSQIYNSEGVDGRRPQ
jgi:hypothetical protein